MPASVLLLIVLVLALQNIYEDWRICVRWHIASIFEMLLAMSVAVAAYVTDRSHLGWAAFIFALVVRFGPQILDEIEARFPPLGVKRLHPLLVWGNAGRYRLDFGQALATAEERPEELSATMERLSQRWLTAALSPSRRGRLLLDFAYLWQRARVHDECARCYEEAMRCSPDLPEQDRDWGNSCLAWVRASAELGHWDAVRQGLSAYRARPEHRSPQWPLTGAALLAMLGQTERLERWVLQHPALQSHPYVALYWEARSQPGTEESKEQLQRAAALAGANHDIVWNRACRLQLEAPQPLSSSALSDVERGQIDALLSPLPPTLERLSGSRVPPATMAILLACFLVWDLEEWLGGSSNQGTLYELGAATHAMFVDRGGYWRLFTAVFLHAGKAHLFFNCSMIYVLGLRVESIYGSARTLAIFLVSGTLANLASMPFELGQGVGASGGAMALLGAWGAAFLRISDRVPPAVRRRQLLWVALVVAIQTVFDQMIPYINGTAHLAGLACGLMLGIAMLPGEPLSPKRGMLELSFQRLALALVLPGLFLDWQRPPAERLVANSKEIYVQDEQRALLEALQAVRICPRDEDAWYWLGYIEQHVGVMAGSVEAESRALSLFPDNGQALLVRSNASYLLDRTSSALADCTRALALGSDGGDALAAYINFHDDRMDECRRLAHRWIERRGPDDSRLPEMVLLDYFAAWKLQGKRDNAALLARASDMGPPYLRIALGLAGRLTPMQVLTHESTLYSPTTFSMQTRARIYLAMGESMDGHADKAAALLLQLDFDPVYLARCRGDDLRPIALALQSQLRASGMLPKAVGLQ